MKHEWRKKEKGLYLPKKVPVQIQVPEFHFFTIKGKGRRRLSHPPEADSSANTYFIERFFFDQKKKRSISKLFGGSERRPTVCMEGVMRRPSSLQCQT
jgi:hypothetical protein